MVLAAAVALLVVASFGLEALRFSPHAVVAFRIAGALAFGCLIVFFLVLPLRRWVSDDRVVLYLEEHEPSLDAVVLSAISTSTERDGPATDYSPALVRRLIELAAEKCRSIGAGQRVERQRLRQHTATLGALALGVLILIAFGPAFLRHGASALFLISRSAEAASPYRIEVTPGNAVVPRGSDQTIRARLIGFSSEQVDLIARTAAGGQPQRMPLIGSGQPSSYEVTLFTVANPVDYVVQASGVQSPSFHLDVVDSLYVQHLELEYHFPPYTGLAPRKVEDGGDIAVLRGTEVLMRIVPTMSTSGGRLVLDTATPGALTRNSDGTLSTRFTVDHDAVYHIELNGPKGENVTASPQHTIDVLADLPPTVSFTRPRRDVTATPVEEVFVQAQADDDFGVRDLQLVYSLNGGAERQVTMFNGRAGTKAQVSAGHTFFLEELGVEPGDSIAYYARAADNDQVQGPNAATSDIYFVRVGPFSKDFRPAQSMSGAGAGANRDVGALSEQQRQIISGTFNVARDSKATAQDKVRENTVLLALSQGRLREQVERLSGQLTVRLSDPSAAFKKIGDLLPKAASEMAAAEGKLQAQKPSEALPSEQRALELLQKAEEEYQLEVSVGRNAQGGSGGSSGSMADDLADLFGLELDKLANQYETAQRAEQQSANQQIDELAERLRELAKRQLQEAERQRQSQSRGGQNAQGTGGGANQRQLAQEAEEAGRRLEQLAREQSRPDLSDAARQLQQAADAMRQAAASGDASGTAQASAAAQALMNAQKRLEREQTARVDRDIQDAQRTAAELADEQRQVSAETNALGAQAGAPRDRQNRAERVVARKDAMRSKLAGLEQRLAGAAADARRDQKEASRKLQEAADLIRDNKVKEKIQYSEGLVRERPEYARSVDDQIGADLAALQKTVDEAAASVGRPAQDALSAALEEARDLTQGMESLGERMQQRAGQAARGTQGQRGQGARGEQGQTGQGARGEQGQAGQGANGEQGQTGQGAGRGQAADQGRGGGQPSGRQGRGGTLAGGPFGSPMFPVDGSPGDITPPGEGGYSSEDLRQLQREFHERTSQAADLRQQLARQGVDVRDLDAVLRVLREFDDPHRYADAADLARLQASVVEGLKRFEFQLRRQVESKSDQLLLSGSDEVPSRFRELVDEYYRSLARLRSRPQQP